MADNPVLLITGASTGIGAKTAHHAAEGRLPARPQRPIRGQARSAGVRARRARQGDRRPLRRFRVGGLRKPRQGGDRRLRRLRRRFRQCGLRRLARLPGGVAGALEVDDPHQRPGGRLHDPRHPPPSPRKGDRPLRDHQLGRGPARASGLALLGVEVVGHGDGRGASPGASPDARQHAHPRHADRAGDGRHALLRQPPRERACSRTRTSRTPSCTRYPSPSTST